MKWPPITNLCATILVNVASANYLNFTLVPRGISKYIYNKLISLKHPLLFQISKYLLAHPDEALQ